MVNARYPGVNTLYRNPQLATAQLGQFGLRALGGRMNTRSSFTMRANEDYTDVKDAIFSPERFIALMPTTPDAANEMVAGAIYFDMGVKTCRVYHTNHFSETRSFRYIVLG